MTEYKGTVCTTCSHREVCKFQADLLRARMAVDDVMVHLEGNKSIYLRDIKWIAPVDLRCEHYTYSGGAAR